MELEITLPPDVPVMTLPKVTFFPQALMPLHIYELRYQEMLKDVLASNRLFVVAGMDEKLVNSPDQFEPPYKVASVGIVRACQKNSDGTSNLLLQGLCRVELVEILTEHPYRRGKIRHLISNADEQDQEATKLRHELARLLTIKRKLGAPMPRELTEFLDNVDDPETFVDLAAFSLCEPQSLKQKLLETLDLRARLELFNRQVRFEIEALKLHRRTQAGLPDNQIGHN